MRRLRHELGGIPGIGYQDAVSSQALSKPIGLAYDRTLDLDHGNKRSA